MFRLTASRPRDVVRLETVIRGLWRTLGSRRFLAATNNKWGGNKYGSEEYHIGKALRWLQDKEPTAVVHVDKITSVGLSYLPGIAYTAICEAPVRVQVLTHGDILSPVALRHQLALAEQLNARLDRNKPNKTAIFVINPASVLKQKELESFIDALYGVIALTGGSQRGIAVTGVPNVGKSSLIFPLTKPRTLEIKKKKHYHLPKVSATAGHTLGVKNHVMSSPNYRHTITLWDTPGLRRKVTLAHPETIVNMVATNATEFRKDYKEVISIMDSVDVVLKALNKHARLSAMEVPTYAEKLGIGSYTEDPHVLLKAFRETGQRAESDLIRRCNRGEYGGLIFSARDPVNYDQVNPSSINQGRAIMYMNEAAKTLISYAENPGSAPTDTIPERKRFKERDEFDDDLKDALDVFV